MVRMNHKSVAKEIYAASQQEKNTSAATRYRKQAISGYEQEDRYFIKTYVENICRANHVSGNPPPKTFNERVK